VQHNAGEPDMRQADIVAGSVLAAFGLAAVLWIIPAESARVRDASIQPAVYPLIAAWAIVAHSALMIANGILRRLLPDEDAASPVPSGEWLHVAAVCAILLAALLAFEFVGFVAGGVSLVAVLMIYMGARNPALIAGVAAGATLSIWAFFHLALARPLP
jgi:hypothetical protein